MSELDKKLANRLLYLPIDLHEKVLLWLAYKGLKPVSEITVERRNLALLRRGIRKNTYTGKGSKINRIRKWIRDAGLSYSSEPGHTSSWHVGRDKENVRLSAKIIRKFDFENEYLSGTLFGFPRESAKAYARNRNLRLGEKQTPVVYQGMQAIHSYLRDKYYLPYMFYAIRADRVTKDSLVAKRWADTIRKDVPKLATWHEKVERRRIQKEITLGGVARS